MVLDPRLVVRRFLNRFGYEIIRTRTLEAQPDLRPIEVFSLVIQEYMRSVKRTKLRFMQIGAHDGVSYDPLREFIVKYRWSGVLVEPQPEFFALLKKNYASFSNLAFENVAISDHEGRASLYRFIPDSTTYHGTTYASFDLKWLRNNPKHYTGKIETIDIPCCTLEMLFRKHGPRPFDVFQVDTEGYDGEIIRQLARTIVRPSVIQFESEGLSNRDRLEVKLLVQEMGYLQVVTRGDTIAYLPRKPAALDKSFARHTR